MKVQDPAREIARMVLIWSPGDAREMLRDTVSYCLRQLAYREGSKALADFVNEVAAELELDLSQ